MDKRNALIGNDDEDLVLADFRKAVYYVALVGADDMLVPGSRLTEDYNTPNEAKTRLIDLKPEHPAAALFWRHAETPATA